MKNIVRKKIVQEYYSRRAKEYDKQKIRTWHSEQGFGAEVLNEILGIFADFQKETMLDVGVGSGRIALPLLKEVKPSLIGLDLSREMLELAKAKMSSYKHKFDLFLGDAEHLPFIKETFDAIICLSTMHYFTDSERSLTEFSRVLKEKGIFVYGDLTLHELDNNGFLNMLEKTLSRAHANYFKHSEAKKILENHGFSVSRAKVFPYRKSYLSLIEDKGRYFDVKLEAFYEFLQKTTAEERNMYLMSNNELTLFYSLITARKEGKS